MKKTVLMVLSLASLASASCPKGFEPYNNECVMNIQPDSAAPVKPSDEKPPRDKMPSYQREGVKLVDAPSTSAEDARQDREREQATTEGKRAAGIQ